MSSKGTRASKKKASLDKAETVSLIEMFAQLMNAYSKFSESLGKIQKTHEEAYDNMFSFETLEKFPALMTKITEEAPPELSRLVIGIFSKMTAFLPKIANVMGLSADDKIKLGENLKSLARDFEKLLELIKKEEE